MFGNVGLLVITPVTQGNGMHLEMSSYKMYSAHIYISESTKNDIQVKIMKIKALLYRNYI